jgi:hypothetical protein
VASEFNFFMAWEYEIDSEGNVFSFGALKGYAFIMYGLAGGYTLMEAGRTATILSSRLTGTAASRPLLTSSSGASAARRRRLQRRGGNRCVLAARWYTEVSCCKGA